MDIPSPHEPVEFTVKLSRKQVDELRQLITVVSGPRFALSTDEQCIQEAINCSLGVLRTAAGVYLRPPGF